MALSNPGSSYSQPMSLLKENPGVSDDATSAKTALSAKPGVWLPVAIQVFTATGFAAAYFQGGLSQHATFGKLMQMEFIAIHSGLFLGVFILWRPDHAFWRCMRWVAVALLSVFYLRFGYSIMGWVGVFELIALTFCTYSGLLWATQSARFGLACEIGARWFIGLLAFGLIGRIFGMPQNAAEWVNFPSVLLYGASYFAALGAFEATGIYRRIRG